MIPCRLQALIIVAYSPKWYSFLTNMNEFKKITSVFITASVLRLLQGKLVDYEPRFAMVRGVVHDVLFCLE